MDFVNVKPFQLWLSALPKVRGQDRVRTLTINFLIRKPYSFGNFNFLLQFCNVMKN